MLKVQELSVAYGQVKAVQQVSLELKQGETVALLGVNGAGKSTILLALSGMLKPERGKIFYHIGHAAAGKKGKAGFPPWGERSITNAQVHNRSGERVNVSPVGVLPNRRQESEKDWADITDWGAQERLRMGIALVPEGRHVFPTATVRENLLVGAHIRADHEVEQDIEGMYRLFPVLYEKRNVPAMALSGGQQQMLAIARALMSRPRLLLLDEPTMGLSPKLCAEVYHFIEKSSEDGLTVLVSGEDGKSLRRICSHAITVVNGNIRS